MDREAALISIVVPVHNVEKYLDRCMQSLVAQTHKNLEIILINDGSEDSSPAICDRWAQKDDRIVVVHQNCKGVSAARNLGIDLTHGEYICFVDSDDWVDRKFIEILYRLIVEYNCDLAECGSRETWGETYQPSYEFPLEVHSKSEAMKAHLEDTRYTCVVWNKLYKRKILSVRFPEGKFHEDMFWTYQIRDRCTALVHASVPLYFHFHHSSSITGRPYTASRIENLLEGCYERSVFIVEHYPELADAVRKEFSLKCLWYIQLLKRERIDPEKRCEARILNWVRKNGIAWLGQSRASVKERFWITAFCFFPGLTASLRNVLKIGV